MKLFFSTAFILIAVIAQAQVTFPVNGIKPDYKGHYAYTNATIYITHDKVERNATLLIQNNKVIAVGANVKIPADAVVTNMKGEFIYPAFLDLYSSYGIAAPETNNDKRGPQYLSNKKGPYSWNEAVKPEVNAFEIFKNDSAKAEALRAMGFAFAVTHAQDGIMRGTGALVALTGKPENETVVTSQAATFYSFNKGSSTQDYPSSLMGSIALLRQTFYDARWHANGGSAEEQNLSLEAINRNGKLPKVFDVGSVQSALRADKIADEFNMPFIVKGNGDEYQRIAEIKASNTAFIVPLTFPKPFDIANLNDAAYALLASMKHWEMAPFNPRILHEHGVSFCFTATGIEKPTEFLNNLRTAVKNGLPKSAALKALTTTPAELLGITSHLGSLEAGRNAAFIVTTGDLFSDTSRIVNVHVLGRDHVVSTNPIYDIAAGRYKLSINKLGPFDLVIDDNPAERKPYIQWNDTMRIPVVYSYTNPFVTFEFALPGQPQGDYYRLSGYTDSTGIAGNSFLPNGTAAPWRASFYQPFTRNDTLETRLDSVPAIPSMLTPFQSFGWDTLPKVEDVIFKNATVWTNESNGVMTDTDVWIRNGKIFKVGKKLSGAAVSIDATGKHLTSGIIDEHSHIAIAQGVNEGTQSVTSEVRIADVINPNDVNIYRQLAGGVTCSHLLHGSANCIGGQSQLIKLRWGYGAEELKFKDWPGFIKFALGENVKQSHWGDQQTVRFPQTRMGVEQVFYDAFIRAKQYKLQLDALQPAKKKQPLNAGLRRDLELDALVEILDEKRFITCHSYVQSEINMLMTVADSMNFKVNTFTHILEGYKVADQMKAHGAHASTFSDWWGYKYEVIDAIPYNGALLHHQGINTSFNSDDAEMARRLNQEAAKAVKYGGVSEEEAWKFVTLNPAKMLHVEDKVGSIKEGKDADVVLWSDNPLSIYARAERTYVDGICFYNLEDDQRKRDFILAEKARLLSLMQEAKKSGIETQSVEPHHEAHYHCDTLGEFVK